MAKRLQLRIVNITEPFEPKAQRKRFIVLREMMKAIEKDSRDELRRALS